jgi:copper chaperone NosL
VAAVFVTNYYDGEIIAARTALFVVGSNALGPTGHELVPHQSYAAAEYFMRDHDGRRILRFDEVTEAILHELM